MYLKFLRRRQDGIDTPHSIVARGDELTGAHMQHMVETTEAQYWLQSFLDEDALLDRWPETTMHTHFFGMPEKCPVVVVIARVPKGPEAYHYYIGRDCFLYVLNESGKTIDSLQATIGPEARRKLHAELTRPNKEVSVCKGGSRAKPEPQPVALTHDELKHLWLYYAVFSEQTEAVLYRADDGGDFPTEALPTEAPAACVYCGATKLATVALDKGIRDGGFNAIGFCRDCTEAFSGGPALHTSAT